MKSFKEIREATNPAGDVVFKAKAGGSIKNVNVSVTKSAKGFTVIIDGDKLDTFKSEGEAMKALKTTVKELGGKL